MARTFLNQNASVIKSPGFQSTAKHPSSPLSEAPTVRARVGCRPTSHSRGEFQAPLPRPAPTGTRPSLRAPPGSVSSIPHSILPQGSPVTANLHRAPPAPASSPHSRPHSEARVTRGGTRVTRRDRRRFPRARVPLGQPAGARGQF